MEADPWSRRRAGLGGLPTPLVVLCAGVMPNTCSSPFTSEAAIHFCLFCISLFITAWAAWCLQIFLVCYSFSVFCCSRRYLSRCQCKHSSTGSQALYSVEMVHVDFVIKGGTESKVKPWPWPHGKFFQPRNFILDHLISDGTSSQLRTHSQENT